MYADPEIPEPLNFCHPQWELFKRLKTANYLGIVELVFKVGTHDLLVTPNAAVNINSWKTAHINTAVKKSVSDLSVVVSGSFWQRVRNAAGCVSSCLTLDKCCNQCRRGHPSHTTAMDALEISRKRTERAETRLLTSWEKVPRAAAEFRCARGRS